MPTIRHPATQAGFTLIELSIVVLVIALLLGGLIVPLSAQVEQRRVSDTQRMLAEIREALIGFAVANGRLPCPSTATDPSAATYGEETRPCHTSPAAEGFLPWRTLGVPELDAWGIRRRSAADLFRGNWRYRVDSRFAGDPGNGGTLITLANAPADNIRIVDNANLDLTSATERAVAVVYSTGPNGVSDGQNTTIEVNNPIYQSGDRTGTFDDMTIWIGRPLLFARMVAAGRLP